MTARRLLAALTRRWGVVNSAVMGWLWARRAGHSPRHLGTAYGGWYCFTDLLRHGELAVCIGAGEDVSFDVILNAQFGMRVKCIDATPRAIAHVEALLAASATKQTTFEDAKGAWRYSLRGFECARFQLLPFAVWSRDADLDLYLPRDPSHVSLSAVNLQNTSTTIKVKARRLSTLLDAGEQGQVALLKMDIEGAEAEVIKDLASGSIRPRQLLVEFEEFNRPRGLWVLPRALRFLKLLRRADYQLCHVSGSNLLFVQRSALSGLERSDPTHVMVVQS